MNPQKGMNQNGMVHIVMAWQNARETQEWPGRDTCSKQPNTKVEISDMANMQRANMGSEGGQISTMSPEGKNNPSSL